jgi:uncharacterized protein
MATRVSTLVLIAAAALGAVGCASAQSRFYSLNSTATPTGSAATQGAVMVGPVTVPASVDQPQFLVQVAPNQVEVEEFDRWDAPLNDGIARAVAGDLAAQLGIQNVSTDRLANFNPTYWVTIDVRRFDSIRGESAVVDAVWVVRKTRGGQTRSGRTVAREPVQGDGFQALAAAHSRALATVSSDIADAIRTLAQQENVAGGRVSETESTK